MTASDLLVERGAGKNVSISSASDSSPHQQHILNELPSQRQLSLALSGSTEQLQLFGHHRYDDAALLKTTPAMSNYDDERQQQLMRLQNYGLGTDGFGGRSTAAIAAANAAMFGMLMQQQQQHQEQTQSAGIGMNSSASFGSRATESAAIGAPNSAAAIAASALQSSMMVRFTDRPE